MEIQRYIETVEHEIAILLRRASLSRRNLTVLDRAAYLLLRQLDEHGSAGVKALAEEFKLDVSTVSRQAAALESKGFIQRTQDPNDHRSSTFRLTDVGYKRLTEEKENRVAVYTKLLDSWASDDIQKLGELLCRLNRTFVE
ncbi:MarR family transcriptional regulator [Alicyclobacillus tolerans]|uniref:MarR family winged helix-turn-helix transcriptional regulator n=1 Tax=Alicyclobacillus tolerans TaxID=90970 RepID=UPI001F022F70|nr:MarR family transcriptional regulator [Alicyclobacillus tolerans]MCF8568097.1 MarR family transcriptional regulator [Alicyclobacillus tolerans]